MLRYLAALSLLVAVLGCNGGCSSTKAVSMKPVDARIPELRFWYEKNGQMKDVYGSGGDYFNAGDAKQFKVKLHKNGGNCQLTYTDGDSNFTKDCRGMSTYTLDLGTYYVNHPSVVGISVAMEKLGIQQGYFYPQVNPSPFPELPVSYKCPQQESTDGISVCTRPATYQFNFTVSVKENFPGLLQYARKCVSDATETVDVFTINGAGDVPLTFNSSLAQYCTISVALKQNPQPDGSYAIKKKNVIHLNFYNPQYIPLPIPVINKVANGWQVCGAEEYDATSLNLVDGGGIGSGKCKTVNASSMEALAWDDIGRFSWNTSDASGRSLFLDATTSSKTSKSNGYYFYTLARPWVENQVLKKCRANDEQCIRSHINEVMRDPKMIKAVENWDSSILYK